MTKAIIEADERGCRALAFSVDYPDDYERCVHAAFVADAIRAAEGRRAFVTGLRAIAATEWNAVEQSISVDGVECWKFMCIRAVVAQKILYMLSRDEGLAWQESDRSYNVVTTNAPTLSAPNLPQISGNGPSLAYDGATVTGQINQG